MVIAAQTTGGRAAFGWSNILGIFYTGTDLFKSLEPVIECRIGPVEIFKITVPGARATEYDLSLFFQDFRINDGIACGAKTTGFFNQHSCPPLHNSSTILFLVTLMFVSAVYYRYWSATLLVSVYS
jgi:hypothetical protein